MSSLTYWKALASESHHHWNYENHGPDAWPQLFEKCKGQSQSPIDIVKLNVEYDRKLRPFQLINYDAVTNWNVSHNGHTGMDKKINLHS